MGPVSVAVYMLCIMALECIMHSSTNAKKHRRVKGENPDLAPPPRGGSHTRSIPLFDLAKDQVAPTIFFQFPRFKKNVKNNPFRVLSIA